MARLRPISTKTSPRSSDRLLLCGALRAAGAGALPRWAARSRPPATDKETASTVPAMGCPAAASALTSAGPTR
ncbi:hypothetical protein ACWEQ2_31250 [Streptomyces sp. NPDC004096]